MNNFIVGYSKKMKFSLLISLLLIIGCSSTSETTLTLIDIDTHQPIEGAWIHFPDNFTVMRSDVNGEVNLPKDFGVIEIISKRYATLSLSYRELTSNTIELEIDSSRLNVVEEEFNFTQADTLIGAYNEIRSNNDLLYYDLDVKLDIKNKYISGVNIIEFMMLKNDRNIQIDLHEQLNVDSIKLGEELLSFDRKYNSVIIEFPRILRKNHKYNIDFYYSGHPIETGRFGGIVFEEDSLGNPWIYTACQGPGANVWWPNKDQQFDEPDSMLLSVSVLDTLMDISNGHLSNSFDLEDGYRKYVWKISYPINNYCVALNIADYIHFSDDYDGFNVDYYVLPYHLDLAKKQFKQVVPMLECYEKHFGEYPFPKDGFKLVEVPYSGMEHQTAVSYGNGFTNGYNGRDWTGVGISPRFDFIIVHESGHEWFGNIITASDDSDAWIHEGWTTYAEAVYVECMWGYKDALKYLNGYKDLMYNREPILGPTGVDHWPTRDMYFKGALLLNTLRSIINNDYLWWSMVYEFSYYFRGQNIYVTDVISFINNYFGMDLTKIFEQYMMFSDIPILELKYNSDSIDYRWNTDVDEFNMPILAGVSDDYDFIFPTTEWQSFELNPDDVDDWNVDTNKFYVDVKTVE